MARNEGNEMAATGDMIAKEGVEEETVDAVG